MASSTDAVQSWRTAPCRHALQGELRIPGDKSISHRAVMFASIAEGVSEVTGFLEGADTRATARVMQSLGVRVHGDNAGRLTVHGVGLHGLKQTADVLDCGNAGTAMRLLTGLLAGQSFASTLVGDGSLSVRPMGRVAEPLREMGASIRLTNTGTAPVSIEPVAALKGIRLASPVASAQVKSAVLLAGLYASGETEVVEAAPTRDYTESMLAAMGADIRYSSGHAVIRGGGALKAHDITVPADFSSAAFALVAACIVPGSHIILPSIGVNPRRAGLLDALRLMGANITVHEEGSPGLATLHIEAAALQGIDVPQALVPDMIDEFPALFVAAACAEGVTRVRGAAELRVKESDRIAQMAKGLRALGIRVDETPDGADIHGGTLNAGSVDAAGDHRIAMAFAVAGQWATGPVEIHDVANVETSYPGFVQSLRQIGGDIEFID